MSIPTTSELIWGSCLAPCASHPIYGYHDNQIVLGTLLVCHTLNHLPHPLMSCHLMLPLPVCRQNRLVVQVSRRLSLPTSPSGTEHWQSRLRAGLESQGQQVPTQCQAEPRRAVAVEDRKHPSAPALHCQPQTAHLSQVH